MEERYEANGKLDLTDEDLAHLVLAGVRTRRHAVAVEMVARGLGKDAASLGSDAGSSLDEFVRRVRERASEKEADA